MNRVTKQQKVALLKIGFVAAILAGFLVATRLLPLGQWMQQFTGWMKTHGALGILVFILAYVLGTSLGAPAALFIIVATVAFGLAQGFLIAWISCLVAASISLVTARNFFRGFTEKILARNERLKIFDSMISREGWKIILLLRLTPVLPFCVCNYFAALTRIGFLPYLTATALGVIPATLFYAYLGMLGKVAADRHERSPQEYAFMVLGLVATVFAVFYLTRIAKRSLRQMEQKIATPTAK